MKNGLSLRQQQLQVIMYYIITWAFHTLTCRQNKCTPKKQTILSFFFTSEIYRDFSWATVLKRLLTAPVFHNWFLIIIYIFDDSSDPFKTENGHHSINLTDDVCSPSKPVITWGSKFIRGVHIMLFPQIGNKDPNELGCHNKHDTNGWVNLSVITVESFLLYPDEPLM